MNTVNIDYLGNNKWIEISREERMYCAYLYFDILKNGVNSFIESINTFQSPTDSFKNKINLDSSKNWEIGYEVCFHRDILYNNGQRIKLVNFERQRNNEKVFPVKRTFDLCLFSQDAIIIIEAKAQSKLGTNQCVDFKDDKKNLENLFEHLKIKNRIVKLIVLASSQYMKSPSFINGTAKKFIDNMGNSLLGFISWKQIQEIFRKNLIYTYADDSYTGKSH